MRPAAQPAAAPASSYSVDNAEYASRWLTRVALIGLRTQTDHDARDAAIAGLVLELAQRFAPRDPEIARRCVDAWREAGDQEAMIEATRRVVELDPSDTVAQLRLIAWQVARLQTSAERLAAYERFIGSRAIDASVRSRLALDAALLHRERGDDAAFARVLDRAMSLDVSNKEAAALAWTYVASRTSDPVARFESLEHLLMADPLDPNVHMQIADLLATSGSSRDLFAAARRFHQNALLLTQQAGQAPPDARVLSSLVLDWEVDGAEDVLDRLTVQLEQLRFQAARQRQVAEEQQMPLDDLPRPEEVRLPPSLDTVRLAVASALEQDEACASAVLDLALSIKEQLEILQDPRKRPEQITQEQAIVMGTRLFLEIQAVRGWTGQQIGQFIGETSQFSVRQFDPAWADVIAAYTALRSDDPRGAIATFALVPESRADLRAHVLAGTALAHLALDETDAGAAKLEQLARESPLSVFGAWARTRLARMGRPLAQGASEAALVRGASGVPRWVDEMTQNPRSFMAVSIEPARATIGALEPCRLVLRLRNMCPIALGVGPDRPLCSKFLISPRFELALFEGRQLARPEVFHLDRRLRLQPGEEMSVAIWPDAGPTGWFLEAFSHVSVRVAWRMIQGFTVTRSGVLDAGPLCISTQTPTQLRSPVAESRLGADAMIALIASADASRAPFMAASVRARVIGGGDFGAPASEQQKLATALGARYASLPPAGRAVLVLGVPTRVQSTSMESFDTQLASEADANVLGAILAARVGDPESPLFERAIASGDPLVARLATLLRDRLRDGKGGYATMTMLATQQAAEVQPDRAGGAEGGSVVP
jgi:hypothetical protein